MHTTSQIIEFKGFTKKFLTAAKTSEIKLSFNLPPSPEKAAFDSDEGFLAYAQTFNDFRKSELGTAYAQGVKAILTGIADWCKEKVSEDIHEKIQANLDRFFESNQLKEEQLKNDLEPADVKKLYPLLTEGVSALATILSIINPTEKNSTKINPEIIVSLCEKMVLCGPGTHTHIMDTLLTITTDQDAFIMGYRKKIAQQTALKIISTNFSEGAMRISPGNQMHYVIAVFMQFPEIGLETYFDGYTETNVNSSILHELSTKFAELIPQILTPDNVIKNILIDWEFIKTQIPKATSSKDIQPHLNNFIDVLNKLGKDPQFNFENILNMDKLEIEDKCEIVPHGDFIVCSNTLSRLLREGYLTEPNVEACPFGQKTLQLYKDFSLNFSYFIDSKNTFSEPFTFAFCTDIDNQNFDSILNYFNINLSDKHKLELSILFWTQLFKNIQLIELPALLKIFTHPDFNRIFEFAPFENVNPVLKFILKNYPHTLEVLFTNSLPSSLKTKEDYILLQSLLPQEMLPFVIKKTHVFNHAPIEELLEMLSAFNKHLSFIINNLFEEKTFEEKFNTADSILFVLKKLPMQDRFNIFQKLSAGFVQKHFSDVKPLQVLTNSMLSNLDELIELLATIFTEEQVKSFLQSTTSTYFQNILFGLIVKIQEMTPRQEDTIMTEATLFQGGKRKTSSSPHEEEEEEKQGAELKGRKLNHH